MSNESPQPRESVQQARLLHRFCGGLHLATGKELTDTETAIQHPLPRQIILPLQQHIGLPAEPIVRVGEPVRKGQMIARATGHVSLPIHASTSGVIKDIGSHPVPHPVAHSATCIVLEPDGNDEWCDIKPVAEYASVEPKELQQVIRDCGIAGLGGAGFPAHVKLTEGVDNAVDTLIINGVECEPFITCDDRLIQEKASYVIAGTRMIGHAVQARHQVIAVEDDMPAAYAALEKLVDGDIELVKVPTRYPAGGEKQLIEVLTGKQVPSGGLPIHIGIVMHNVATAAAVYRAVTRGEPVVSRYVTVTGDVNHPRNLQVLLGTPVRDCLELCDFLHDEECRLIIGGPMMGFHVQHPEIPIIKTTNCILVAKNVPPPPELPCIRCGKCVGVCPVNLMPQQLYSFAKHSHFAQLQNYHLFDCIECGCCAYVCPSRIPLVHYYRQAKAAIADEEKRLGDIAHTRERFMAKQSRLRNAETGKTTAAGGQAGESLPSAGDRKSYIEAAVQRSRQKRAGLDGGNNDSDG